MKAVTAEEIARKMEIVRTREDIRRIIQKSGRLNRTDRLKLESLCCSLPECRDRKMMKEICDFVLYASEKALELRFIY